jgi:phage tail sheath protein FI
MKDRVAILDSPPTADAIEQLTNVEVEDVSPPPAADATATGSDPASRGKRAATATKPAGLLPKESPKGFAAFYYPWIICNDPFDPKQKVNVPPSGHIAGVWARNDATRGVHKAPANEPVRGALDVAYRVTYFEQELLNPLGVNCIRLFSRSGILVWGARTRADKGSEWTYINVRRLFNMIEKSILQSTRWVVFEPNDQTLWKSIRRDVAAFLRGLWRDGMLMGDVEEKAFFVRCDENTNPPESRNEGKVIIEVGIAPIKPAEFVIFRIGQYEAGSEVK